MKSKQLKRNLSLMVLIFFKLNREKIQKKFRRKDVLDLFDLLEQIGAIENMAKT
jgi:hypothetical protein